ncbi:2Fe-2S iron-sulfur cluster-binding protein [Haliangium ochraceum]|uniref:NADH:ubiquinone oxidoreductase, subunit G, iron-sulphur binding protein n=1 Tax=Haliangium ochraceum (strain DSM 14365 / JCM 11303 / SMP-2) TaxID=502025 RepID=D0LPX3_HALO1|nr:2Fe-2S iron-sulfur cluster-binding protein [Haliangium ochraceum]ACY17010.1 NADH:ubiquinone oxidoreductase, subunit G, iron- sulphur binding protein [Haliangium ochraceum DSM 14365]
MSDTESQTQDKVVEETVTLTVDGREVTVPKGTNVLEASRAAGLDISAFCYHPGLSVVAVCRQCLVSIDNVPRMQPSCQTIAADGMVVHTDDDRSTLARKQMLEFTLVNHPVDCPICDKAGECTLQKLYFDHDNAPSRVDVPKVRKPKAKDLGPTIVLDAERCILCTRCIRVCDEVAGEHQLEMSYRGNHEELGTAPGAVLDNPYSLNTVDVCPVGALTAKDFRFTMRAWELYTTPSVCNGCATGCNMEVHHRNDRVWRLIPRHNAEVNEYWMCDEGRFTYHELREQRLAAPVVGGLPSSWERAIASAAGSLKQALAGERGGVGVVLSAQHSNEDNYVLARLARDFWQLDTIYVGGKAAVPERADDILRDPDVNPNTAGVAAIAKAAGASLGDLAALERDLVEGKLSALLVLGHELPLSDEAMAAFAALETSVAIAWREIGVAARAKVALPCQSWAEANGTVTNRQGLVQRMHAAVSPVGKALPAWEVVAQLAQACDAAVSYTHPKKIFEEMVGKIEAFSGAAWGKPARPVQLRFAGSRG